MEGRFIIQTKDLSFAFGSAKIINSVNLEVPYKSIYCFLGPNGSGKTTTIRILLSLLRQNNRAVNMFGLDVQTNRIVIAKKTGSLIEKPSAYLHLTGYQNLLVAARTHNCNHKRIDDVLALTGIDYAKDNLVTTYSLGMKQRLGIALSILHDPELLILDEPTNGLDPQGIVDIRELITNLHNAGKTIFISSHLLAEVEKIATHFGILHRGNLIFQGTKSELDLKQSAHKLFELRTSDNEFVIGILDGLCQGVKEVSGSLLLNGVKSDDVPVFIKKIVENNIDIHKAAFVERSLEDLFIEMTKS